VLVAFSIAIVLIVPSFIVLYVLDQRSLLPGEGLEDRTGMEGGMT
jgi:cytochrome d ubiquinol oxidase subunit II